MQPNPCQTNQISYARIAARCYIKRLESAMPEESPLVRQWILLRTLCARHYGATVKEMAREMNVSQKTIRRDLETFQKAGFPLEETVGDHGLKRWRVDPVRTQPGLTFAFDEAIALYLGRHLMEPLAGTLFWEAAQRAFKKIRATLGTNAQKYVEQFGTMFHQTTVGVSDYSKKSDMIDELMVGIEDHRAVFLTYQSLRATEPVTYDVYPYGLTYHRGSLYLIGRAPEHDDIRHWKVDRIEDAEATQVHFNRPEEFDLQTHFAHSFGVFHGEGEVHVKVRFLSAVARYVQESTWHPTQKLTGQKDGSLLAEFDLDGTEEIKRWILSFGRHAEVLEPFELREDIRAEAENMLMQYAAKHRVEGRYDRRRSI